MKDSNIFYVSPPDTEFGNMSEAQAARFLRIGLSGSSSPIDELVRHLSTPGGDSWFEEQMASDLFGGTENARWLLVDGRYGLEEIKEAKTKAKSLFAKEPGRSARLKGSLGYFLTLAAALAHHNRLISSRGRDDLDFAFEDLAYAVPDPWRELFFKALAAGKS